MLAQSTTIVTESVKPPEQLDTCELCGKDPGGTFYFLFGKHYCLPCMDSIRRGDDEASDDKPTCLFCGSAAHWSMECPS